MELDWSEQSPHIRMLFRPWQPGDGYDEATVQEAEARLSIRLPATLRNFYHAWGRRRDLTETLYLLLPPDHLRLQSDVLEFWVDTHAGVLWGIQCDQLAEADPPVVVAWDEEADLAWTPSHARLSDFLDDMTYQHALHGGAPYWGYSVERVQEPQQIRWLEDHWRKARVNTTAFEGTLYAVKRPIVYIREGQAASWDHFTWLAAANSAEALEEIAQALQITWAQRW